MEKTLEKNLDEKVKEFARTYNNILAISKGFSPHHPENIAYYLISNDRLREYKPIIDFEEKIFKDHGVKIHLEKRRKINKDSIEEYVSSISYFGEIIWERN